MRFADRGDDPIFTALGPVLFALANLVVLGLALRTGVALVRGRLLPGPAQPKTGA
jgi:tellurite resistance protein